MVTPLALPRPTLQPDGHVDPDRVELGDHLVEGGDDADALVARDDPAGAAAVDTC